MQIFCSTGGFKLPPENVVDDFSKAGIRNIELSGGVHSPSSFDKLFRYSTNNCLQLHNYFPPPEKSFVLNLASTDDSILAASKDLCKKAIDWSSKFGAKRYSFHAGFLVDPRPSELGGVLSSDRLTERQLAIEIFVNSVLELSSYAQLRNVDLLIENNVLAKRNLVGGTVNPLLMVDPHEILEIMAQLPSNIGILLDLAHLSVSARTLEFCRLDAVRSIGCVTAGYHLSENNRLRDSNDPLTEDSWFWSLLNLNVEFATIEVYRASGVQLLKQVRLAESMVNL